MVNGIESFDGENIVARLARRGREHAEEVVELTVDQVADDDLKLVEPGAVFYWTLGRRTTRSGAVQSFSEVRFRRLPGWSEGELEAARLRAVRSVFELFGADDES